MSGPYAPTDVVALFDAAEGTPPGFSGLAPANAQVFNVRSSVFAGGAKGDGVTDDTAAIQAALDVAIAQGGGIVYCPQPAAYYRLLSAGLRTGSNVRLVLDPGTTIQEDGAFDAITAKGTFGPAFSDLTVDGVAGAYSVTVASGAIFAKGMYVQLEDQTNSRYAQNVVQSVAGNVVALRYPLPLAFTVANGSRVVVVVPVVNASVEGGRVVTTGNTIGVKGHIVDHFTVRNLRGTTGRHHVLVEFGLRCHVEDILSEGCGTALTNGPAIGFTSCVGSVIAHCRNYNQLTDEAVTLYQNNQYCVVDDCEAVNGVGAHFQVDHQNQSCVMAHCRSIVAGNIAFYNVTGNQDCWFVDCFSTGAGTDAFNLTGAVGGGLLLPRAGGHGGWGINIDATSQYYGYWSIGSVDASGSGQIQDLGQFGAADIISGSIQPRGQVNPASNLLSGQGVPAAGLGGNGDFFFRVDGGAGAHLYFKAGGAWGALV